MEHINYVKSIEKRSDAQIRYTKTSAWPHRNSKQRKNLDNYDLCKKCNKIRSCVEKKTSKILHEKIYLRQLTSWNKVYLCHRFCSTFYVPASCPFITDLRAAMANCVVRSVNAIQQKPIRFASKIPRLKWSHRSFCERNLGIIKITMEKLT